MKILVCVVTYNRLEYTKRCLHSLFSTIEDGNDYRIVVVDNASADDTPGWLVHTLNPFKVTVTDPPYASRITVVRNTRNLFPGAATNIGWAAGLRHAMPDADLLMRLDNDMLLQPGWREHVEDLFSNVWELGLFGLHNRHEDYDGNPPVTERRGVNVQWDNVGGNCVIRRQLWDQGLRWQPGSWRPGGADEDTLMSHEVKKRGLLVGCAIPRLVDNMSFHRYADYPSYYNETASIRGLVPELSV